MEVPSDPVPTGEGSVGAKAIGHDVLLVDIAFFQDELYVVTKADDLFALHLAEDKDGKPMITGVKRIINHAPGHEDDMYYEADMWKRLTNDIGSSSDDEHTERDYEASCEHDNHDTLIQEDAHYESAGEDSDNEHLAFSEEDTFSECEEGVKEGYDAVHTSRHLIKSQCKLLMVKRERLIAASTPTDHTRKIKVFEADMVTGTWVPLNGGLGGGQAVPFCGEVEEDVMYFLDTNDVFDMRSATIRPIAPMDLLDDRWRVWVFPPDLVV
ncbi:unnamed protein product [Triticum turgidum subsp. durum]|uniref:DUF295 domain-containing protein n=1 Tax=Triticum turgidum subsp. durum TaxID=4567 RepID=A0A9R0YA43_TRITD|nr:unnamed protein product [Triticum turgidum subsp. durum]